jgi:nitrous oxidase accessory protein NosD
VVNANIFADCGVGIRVSGEYLDIGGNTIATCASSGILVEDAYEAWVFANEISGGYAGVEVRRCQNAEVCDNVIHHSIVGVNLTFGHENTCMTTGSPTSPTMPSVSATMRRSVSIATR